MSRVPRGFELLEVGLQVVFGDYSVGLEEVIHDLLGSGIGEAYLIMVESADEAERDCLNHHCFGLEGQVPVFFIDLFAVAVLLLECGYEGSCSMVDGCCRGHWRVIGDSTVGDGLIVHCWHKHA